MTIPNKAIKRLLAITLLIAMIACSGCTPPEQATHTDFIQISHGWPKQTPLHFHPQMPDSAKSYKLDIAIRRYNRFAYTTLPITIDLIDSTHRVQRLQIDIPITDSHGNQLGTGFGNLYQHRINITHSVNPRKLRQINVWHRLDTLISDITEIGIFATPEK